MPTSTGLYDTSTITYDQSSLSYDGYGAPLANLPAVGVYVAFNDGPYVAEPVFTDVSYLTRDVSIRRGRQDDLQQFPSGQCSITFDNRDRYFDPFNTASPAPFNGNLKPRRQVKIVAIWNGVSYPLFRGFVAGWPVEYTEAGFDSTVTVDCFDVIGLVGASTINRNFYDEYVLSLGPKRYYPFSERPDNNKFYDLVSETAFVSETGVTTIVPGGGGVTLPWTTSSITQGKPMFPGLDTPSIFSWYDGAVLVDSERNTTATGVGQDCSMSFVAQLNERSFLFTFTFGNFRIAVNSSRSIAVQSATGTFITLSTPVIDDNKPHHFTFTFNNTTKTLRSYVDGKQTGFTTTAGAGMFVFPLSEARFEWFGLSQIQNLATFERELSATETQTLYQAAQGQFAETTAQRVVDYLGYTNLPSGMYEVAAAVSTQVLELEPEAAPVLPELAKLMSGEDGQMFVDSSGVLQFFGRYSVFGETRSNTSQVVFTDSGVGVNYDNTPIRMQFDADGVRNSVTVRGSNSTDVVSVDTASITANGQSAESVETYLIDPVAAQSLADYRVSIYKTPKLSLDPFVAKGQQNPDYNWPRLLGLELLDRVTFKRTPSVGSAVQRDLLVQAIEHRITPGTWETVVNGSTRYTGWFIIGTSLLGSSEDVLL